MQKWALLAAVAFVAGMTAHSAQASDPLPLQRGIFVSKSVACKDAATAYTLSYWGGNAGINDSNTNCNLLDIAKLGKVYTLNERCAPSAQPFHTYFHTQVIEILGSKSLRIGATTYHYCSEKLPSKTTH